MASPASTADVKSAQPLDVLDRAVVAYLMLPVALFVMGWFRWWVALVLIAGLLLAARCLISPLPAQTLYRLTRPQVLLAVLVGCIWVYFSGIDHLVFTNADWYTRDAVLHDLVSAPWPVVYRLPDATELLLRAPLGFYMPAAAVGKLLGLSGAHVVLALWATLGVILFLLQAMSLAASRLRTALVVALIVIAFSGLDFLATLLNWGPRFLLMYDVTSHLEWWAGSYQYSSMTTQLFWVPNHALGAWVLMGLLARAPVLGDVDTLAPVLLVCATVWSPLSALGILPFMALRLFQGDWRARARRYLQPAALAPALLLVGVLVLYFTMDTGQINKGVMTGAQSDGDFVTPLLSQFQFFLFEAGFLGVAILSIRPSAPVVVALLVLLLLPAVHLGPANDLVMRTSIPSLVILLLACCAALFEPDPTRRLARRKGVLVVLLAIGALTAVHEFARAVLVPRWPINLRNSLIAVSCGVPPHYVARLADQPISRLLRPSEPVPVGVLRKSDCLNPAWEILYMRENKRLRGNTL